MSEASEICAVVGDLGGAAEVVPAMKELGKRGHAISYFLDASPKAKAGSVLDAAGVKYEKSGVFEGKFPKVIVIGTSATAYEAQAEWTKFGLKTKTPVIWVEDLYGTGERKHLHSVSPDAMCVIDAIAESIAKNVRPELRTYITGKPSFEKLPQLIARKAEIRKTVRATLNVGENDFFVPWLFGGDPPERSWTQLRKFAEEGGVDFIRDVGIALGLRFHPKHPEFEKQMQFVGSLGINAIDTRPIKDAKELMLAADMVFADWGNTDAVTSLLARVPVATLLFPDDTQRLLDGGYPKGVPPLLLNYENWGMKSVDDMLKVLEDTNGDGAEAAQEETAKRAKNFQQLLVPGAASRIADVVESYLH